MRENIENMVPNDVEVAVWPVPYHFWGGTSWPSVNGDVRRHPVCTHGMRPGENPNKRSAHGSALGWRGTLRVTIVWTEMITKPPKKNSEIIIIQNSRLLRGSAL